MSLKNLIFICFLILVSHLALSLETKSNKNTNFLRAESTCKDYKQKCSFITDCCGGLTCCCSFTKCKCHHKNDDVCNSN